MSRSPRHLLVRNVVIPRRETHVRRIAPLRVSKMASSLDKLVLFCAWKREYLSRSLILNSGMVYIRIYIYNYILYIYILKFSTCFGTTLASFWSNNLSKPLDGVPVEQNQPTPAKKGGLGLCFGQFRLIGALDWWLTFKPPTQTLIHPSKLDCRFSPSDRTGLLRIFVDEISAGNFRGSRILCLYSLFWILDRWGCKFCWYMFIDTT